MRAATREDALAIAPRLRMKDAMGEIWARQGKTSEQAVLDTFEGAMVAWVWEVDGLPACMWGITKITLIGGMNIGWMLTTEVVERDYRTFWRGCMRGRAPLLDQWRTLEGCCDARFEESVRWLKRLGAKLGPPVVVEGITYHHFEMRA